jgi:large subunit ribosomal protein L21
MYAIVEIAGQQFKVENGKKIFVHRLEFEEGKEVEFDKVLLIEDEGKITIGEPTIKDAVVGGKILDNTIRGEKVIVFKKKRKKVTGLKTDTARILLKLRSSVSMVLMLLKKLLQKRLKQNQLRL